MWEQIVKNNIQSTVALVFLFLIMLLTVGLAGFSISPTYEGIAVGVVVAVFLFIALFVIAKNDSMKLFAGSSVVPCDKNHAPVLFNVVEEMSIAAGLPKPPEIYIMDTPVPNAFATGVYLEKSSICVTKGLLELLDRNELQGVVAHEIGHIVNRDVKYILFAGIMVSIIAFTARVLSKSNGRRSSSGSNSGGAFLAVLLLIVVILAPILSRLFYFSLSRKREYLADACAAQFTRYPVGLANALKKIEEWNKLQARRKKIVKDSDETSEFNENPLIAAACIVPCSVKKDKDSLFSTHPSTANRINVLMAMTSVDYSSYNTAYTKVTKEKPLISNRDMSSCKNQDIILPVGVAMLVNDANLLSSIESTSIEDKIMRKREAEDIMWKHSGYIIINCDCGTRLKLPPSYKGKEIICPHCKKNHFVN